MTNSARFLGLLIELFPELREKINSEQGIYMKTREFAEFANAAIYRGDWATLTRCYTLVDRVLNEEPDKDVYNALYVSFIEHLDFHKEAINGRKAKSLLPARLFQAWNELNDYWRNLSNKKKHN